MPDAKTMRLSIALPSDLTVSTESPDVTLSPDGGTALVAAADSSGTSHLYVRPLNVASTRMLPGTDGAVIPFWSPDSKQIAFFADGNLKRMGINDDGAQVICAAPAPRGGDWGPDNVIVFAPAASGPLMQVAASGGTPAPATTLDKAAGETAHRFPQFLPDGKHFLYVALPGTDNKSPTRVATLGGASESPVVVATGRATYAAPGYLLFNQNGSIMAQRFDAAVRTLQGSPAVIRGLKDASGQYSGSPALEASSSGTLIQREVQQNDTRLVMVDRTGRSLRQIAVPVGVYRQMRFSPDASRLALTYSKNGDPDRVWLVDIARGITTRFAFEGAFDVAPIWTPDGKRVIWGSDRTDGRNLYWKNADGSGKEELLCDAPGLFNDPNSTATGVLVFRCLSGETSEDLWTVSLSGDKTGKPLIASRFNENDGELSPDGRWMAYRSDESGRMEIYVTSFPSLDQRVQVSSDGSSPGTTTTLTMIRWRKDLHELYYIGSDQRSVMAVPIDAGEQFHAGTPKALFKLPRETVDADTTPDGQMFVLSVPAQEGRRSIINLVMNWDREIQSSK
jgi:Tol biopolymer transport system component